MNLICDIECYRNYFLIAFERIEDGKRISFELRGQNERFSRDQIDRIKRLMRQYTIVTFNGNSYDLWMIYASCKGKTCDDLKEISDLIITSGIKRWEIGREIDIRIPEIDHIDLYETNSSVKMGLKVLNGRLHGRRMQDLPFEPERILSDDEMDLLKDYCVNGDIPATRLLFDCCKEPLVLRVAMGKKYGADFRSKSDAQMGEAIIRMQVEKELGERIPYPKGVLTRSFKYDIPEFIKFENPDLLKLLSVIEQTTFVVGNNGKVQKPKGLEDYKIKIGNSVYSFGIGGLHSSEANRALYTNHNGVLIDADVASQYPNIILKLGLFPKALGPAFLKIYRELVETRLAAKRRGDEDVSNGLKRSVNGSFGKFGSAHGVLQAPHMMIAVTIGCQIAVLMLIDQAERRGFPVVSGNTDGVLFFCPWHRQAELKTLITDWEKQTGFVMELNKYRSIFNQSVNTYMAIGLNDGKVKRKGGILKNPWHNPPHKKPDFYGQMMGNPQTTVISDAIADFLAKGIPIEKTIRECRDVRRFITVIRVAGGGTWRGEYLGKVVRYYWSTDGDPILYKKPHPKTGNFKKAQKTEGARPMMTLLDDVPSDLDYRRYIEEAQKQLAEMGYRPSPPLDDNAKQLFLEAV